MYILSVCVVFAHACRPMYADMHVCMHACVYVGGGKGYTDILCTDVDCCIPIPNKKILKKHVRSVMT